MSIPGCTGSTAQKRRAHDHSTLVETRDYEHSATVGVFACTVCGDLFARPACYGCGEMFTRPPGEGEDACPRCGGAALELG